jgi:hypothetical protein
MATEDPNNLLMGKYKIGIEIIPMRAGKSLALHSLIPRVVVARWIMVPARELLRKLKLNPSSWNPTEKISSPQKLQLPSL